MKLPTVGTVFWKRVGPIGWVKHEVRAIVDDRMVFRHWTHKWGGAWSYEVEVLYIWEKVWMRDMEASPKEPYVTLDQKVAAELNRKHGYRQ